MAKKNNSLSKRGGRRQIVAFTWSNDNAGEIIPWQHVNGKWVQEAGVPFGGAIEIRLHKDWLIIQNRSANGNTGH